MSKLNKLKTSVQTILETSEIHYWIDEKTIICRIILNKNNVVVGVSNCFSNETFNEEKGKEAAYNDAVKNLYSHEAYHLKRLTEKGSLGKFTSKLFKYIWKNFQDAKISTSFGQYLKQEFDIEIENSSELTNDNDVYELISSLIEYAEKKENNV